MHRRVAQLLEPHASEVDVAIEIAHHAALGDDALLGVRGCVIAGDQALRVFANADALKLARRGLRLVEDLEDAERLPWTLELLRVQFAAQTPERERAAEQVRMLAEQALDAGLTRAARLGFQMLSFLRWESSSMADAHDNIMQAERVSRLGGPEDRAAALAQAAKCLVLLERNLGQAEAFVMEAGALSKRHGRNSAVLFAEGMICAHRGDWEAATTCFDEARQLAREQGKRLAEFVAVEHRVMVEVDRGRVDVALPLAEDLVRLGEKVREGAEGPSSRALLALARVLAGEAEQDSLQAAVQELRDVDAKYQLAFVLTRWALHELRSSRLEEAGGLAADALAVADAIGRPSEIALARVALFRAGVEPEKHRSELEQQSLAELSLTAKEHTEALLAS
jgi:hypothetical protein